MNYKIIKTSEYEFDILNIIDYLKEQFVGQKIITNLFKEILGTINSLDFMPQRYPEFYKGYIRTLVGRYSIFYKIDEIKKEVKIYAILHQSQDFTKYLK